MTAYEIALISFMIAKEILARVQAGSITEEQLAALIAKNFVTIQGIQKTIADEMAKYGVKP